MVYAFWKGWSGEWCDRVGGGLRYPVIINSSIVFNLKIVLDRYSI
jgi:hypothetical protein